MSETPEQARTRRRWITLAEFVAVAGLLIGAATLYLSWSDRREERAAQASAAASEGKAKRLVTLTGTVADGGRAITLAEPGYDFSAASVRFPSELKLGERDAMPGPRIETDWFADAILAATDGGSDRADGRLPVLVTVEWWDGDAKRRDVARYDVLWRTEGRVLQGRALELTGIVLADRSTSAAALDAAWARVAPKR